MYQHLSWEECIKRYPRIVLAIQRVGVFSTCEAACCVRDYRDGLAATRGISPFDGSAHADWPDMRTWGEMLLQYGGGEAVAHWGGPKVLIRDAIARR
jgi:hypothetical protein